MVFVLISGFELIPNGTRDVHFSISGDIQSLLRVTRNNVLSLRIIIIVALSTHISCVLLLCPRLRDIVLLSIKRQIEVSRVDMTNAVSSNSKLRYYTLLFHSLIGLVLLCARLFLYPGSLAYHSPKEIFPSAMQNAWAYRLSPELLHSKSDWVDSLIVVPGGCSSSSWPSSLTSGSLSFGIILVFPWPSSLSCVCNSHSNNHRGYLVLKKKVEGWCIFFRFGGQYIVWNSSGVSVSRGSNTVGELHQNQYWLSGWYKEQTNF
jgi:hypothetical protein